MENKKETDPNYLNQLLEESKNSIIASSEFDNSKSQDEVHNLISGMYFFNLPLKTYKTKISKMANKKL